MRFAVGLLVNVAQSNGECPGVSSTFFRGLAGMDVWLGGGARPDDGGPRFGNGARDGGAGSEDALLGSLIERSGASRCGAGLRRGICPAPPPARCAEFMAGKEGTEQSSSSGAVEVKIGGAGARGEGVTAGFEGALRKDGGGMAFRSRSAFACVGGGTSGLIASSFFSSFASVFSLSCSNTMLGVCGAKASFAMSFSSSSIGSCGAISGACGGASSILGFTAGRNHGRFQVVGGIL